MLYALWRESFPPEWVAYVERAVESGLPPYEATLQVLPEKPLPGTFAFTLYGVEAYRKAEWARGVVEAFEGERLDIFGRHRGGGWCRRLAKDSRIHLHSTLPYIDQLALLSQSRQLILDPLELHWAAPALAAGCRLVGPPPYPLVQASWERQVAQLLEVLVAG